MKRLPGPEVTDFLGRMAPRLRRALRLRRWKRWLVFGAGAIVTGLAAVIFARGSDAALRFFRETSAGIPAWAWLAPPLGFASIAWLTRRVFPGAQGSGIPQTIAALGVPRPAQRNELLSMRIATGKLLLTVAALGSGASVGREGPTVQIGASIMHSLWRLARFPAVDLDRGLILAGGAAGIAAAFNTPLAGVVFAIEELSRTYEDRTSGTIFTAVIVAGVTSIALVGNYTYFGVTQATLTSVQAWAVVPVCGVVGGLAGGLFARALLAMRGGLPGFLGSLQRGRPVVFAMSCGAFVALLGWWSAGGTFGTGYGEARALVQQEAAASAAFPVLKALATLVSYLAGIPAGIFAPSLAVGAGIGGVLAQHLDFAPGGAIVVLSMAAYFSGVVQAPLTALVIVGEMTGNRGLTLPLMAVCLVGRVASALVCRTSLYRALAAGFMPRDATATSRE